MYDPKDVLTPGGVRDWEHNLRTLEAALFEVTNAADDLHTPENILEACWTLQAAAEERFPREGEPVRGVLYTGDGEKDEDA